MLSVKLFLLYLLGLDRKTRWRPLMWENLHFSSQSFKGKCPWDVRIEDYLFYSYDLLCIHLFSQLLQCFLVHVVTIVALSTLPCLPWLYLNRQSSSTFYTRSVGSLLHRHSWLIFATGIGKFGQTLNFDKNAYSVIYVYFINIQLLFSCSNVNQGCWKWMGFRKEAEDWIRVWKWES